MKSVTIRAICRLLIVSLMMLPFPAAQAGMIGTQQAAAAAGAMLERNAVLAVVERSDVASQLQALGLDTKTAKDRIAAMTDDEVRSLAGNLDALPAGGRNNSAGWLLVIVIAVVIWYNWKR